jgi:hypothetical protein
MEINDSSPFESFEFILKGGEGSHDGRSVTVDFQSAWNMVVMHHEGIHERIFVSSADGRVLSDLLHLRSLAREKGVEIPAAVPRLAETLLNESRLAHEAAATYLGIKQYSPGVGDSVYAKLPDTYQAYYRAMAAPVERLFFGTFLQYALAVDVWAVAFSSPYLARIAESELDEPPMPQPEELPNARFRRITDLLASGTGRGLRQLVFDAAAVACRSDGRDPWDFEDDEAWKANIGVQTASGCTDINTIVENAISRATREWIRDHASLPILEVGEPYARALRLWAERLSPWFRLEFPARDDRRPGREHIRIEAHWQGNSKFRNARVIDVDWLDEARFLSDDLFEEIVSFQVLSRQAPHNRDEWIFIAWRPGDDGPQSTPAWMGLVSAEVLKRWLGRWTLRDRDRKPIPYARAITIAVRDRKEFNELFKPMLNLLSWDIGDGKYTGPGLGALGWYWTGNWVEHLNWLCDGLVVSYQMILIHSSENPSREEAEAAPVLMLLDTPGAPGAILRVLNAKAFLWIGEIMRPLEEGGRLVRWAGEEAAIYAASARNAFEGLSLLWSEF